MSEPTAIPAADPASTLNPARRGLIAGVAAFAIWGALPLYLHELQGVSAVLIMAHRVVWCALMVLLWLGVRGELSGVMQALRQPATRLRLAASATLISVNWLTYVWAVGNGHVVDSSLGYFINPLVNVLLGVTLLSERLNARQWTAVSIAAGGVLWLTVQAGQLPWIALVLAVSFGSYGLIRKTTRVDAVTGLATETVLITPFALAYLLWAQFHGTGAMGGANALQIGLLLAGGIVTAVPLALFAYGAQRIPYSTIGLLQYLAPSLQLILGLSLFGEPFPLVRAIGFILIWLALAIFAADGLRRSWQQRRPPVVAGIETEAPVCRT